MPWGETPRFLVHDNDGIFGQYRPRLTVEKDGKTHSYRCHLDRWLDGVVGVEGPPIPYGAPNANPHVERFNRTLREEALNHFLRDYARGSEDRRYRCAFLRTLRPSKCEGSALACTQIGCPSSAVTPLRQRWVLK